MPPGSVPVLQGKVGQRAEQQDGGSAQEAGGESPWEQSLMWRRPRGWRWPLPSALPKTRSAGPGPGARAGGPLASAVTRRPHGQLRPRTRSALRSSFPFPTLPAAPNNQTGEESRQPKQARLGPRWGFSFLQLSLLTLSTRALWSSSAAASSTGTVAGAAPHARAPRAAGAPGTPRGGGAVRAASAHSPQRSAPASGGGGSAGLAPGCPAGRAQGAPPVSCSPPASPCTRRYSRGPAACERASFAEEGGGDSARLPRSGAGRGAPGSPGSSVGPRPVPARFDRGRGLGAGERPGAVGGPR